MARQLIYTSAPSGIRPGSRGFTTVAMSRDLPPTWVSRLERMSGYNQLFGLSDQRSSLNPVNYSFMRLKVGNDAGLVISRISAAGADYSGRSNSIAHHLVLDRGELPAAGPAWLMQQPGLLAERFDGEPRLIEEPAGIPQGDVPSGPCRLWQKVAGDAGWAGGLLQVAMRGSGSACVIYKPGTDVLGLFAEAMALLPPAQRWQTSFSTYEHGSHSPEGFRWRGLPAGTAAAKEAKNLSDAVVIDLTTPLGAAADNAYSLAAREGRLLEAPKATPTRSAAGAPPARPGKGRRVAAGAATGEEGEYELALAGPRPPSLEYEEGPNLLGSPPPRRIGRLSMSTAAALILPALTVGLVIGLLMPESIKPWSTSGSSQIAQNPDPDDSPQPNPTDTTNGENAPAEVSEPANDKAEEGVQETADGNGQVDQGARDETAEGQKNDETQPAGDGAGKTTPEIIADARTKESQEASDTSNNSHVPQHTDEENKDERVDKDKLVLWPEPDGLEPENVMYTKTIALSVGAERSVIDACVESDVFVRFGNQVQGRVVRLTDGWTTEPLAPNSFRVLNEQMQAVAQFEFRRDNSQAFVTMTEIGEVASSQHKRLRILVSIDKENAIVLYPGWNEGDFESMPITGICPNTHRLEFPEVKLMGLRVSIESSFFNTRDGDFLHLLPNNNFSNNKEHYFSTLNNARPPSLSQLPNITSFRIASARADNIIAANPRDKDELLKEVIIDLNLPRHRQEWTSAFAAYTRFSRAYENADTFFRSITSEPIFIRLTDITGAPVRRIRLEWTEEWKNPNRNLLTRFWGRGFPDRSQIPEVPDLTPIYEAWDKMQRSQQGE